jgi:hypothetical protein
LRSVPNATVEKLAAQVTPEQVRSYVPHCTIPDRVTNSIILFQAQEVAKKIGVVKYIECSAKIGKGFDEVLEAAMVAGPLVRRCRCARRKRRTFFGLRF